MPFRPFIALFLLLAAHSAQADLILLLSDNKPSITRMAQSIQAIYEGKVQTYNLAGDRNQAGEVINAIKNSDSHQVVAIGLLAAQLARENLSSKQVVFSHILSYEESLLVTPWMKGVSALPSHYKQFNVWKKLNPSLKRVAVITSRRMRNDVWLATEAAISAEVELIHTEVSSDREVMQALKRISGQIQGLWLAPDSYILSADLIREIMAYTLRENIQVLAFSPALLREGALLSGTIDVSEAARLVLDRLQQSQGKKNIPGEAELPLSNAIISINGKAAERYGLTISNKLREITHVE